MNNKNSYRNSDNKNEKVRMTANEARVNRGIVRKAIMALTVILTVVSRNLPAVIKWIKALSRADDQQKLTLKGLFCATIGEAAIYGMPTATRNMLQGLSAPRAIVALTNNRKVIWLLNYIEDSYSSMNVKQLVSLAAQFALVGETIESEVTKKSYLLLDEHREMTCEEVENM